MFCFILVIVNNLMLCLIYKLNVITAMYVCTYRGRYYLWFQASTRGPPVGGYIPKRDYCILLYLSSFWYLNIVNTKQYNAITMKISYNW